MTDGSVVCRKDDYAFFLQPVDISQIPGYTDLIKTPMDFGTITQKVDKGRYRSLEEFTVSDILLSHYFLSVRWPLRISNSLCVKANVQPTGLNSLQKVFVCSYMELYCSNSLLMIMQRLSANIYSL